ncbi:MAG: hypothetical protein CVU48_08120 [Candidatus Cloacimonetes bacterium HGW-Cloacimonetes-1]|jgi:2-hydroxy-3-keto-5-methylthiopentenyl-1-phosphate phosphatase|nr:MAG: hypothetical protein CVU48_08120 [Candidatus Cloacimonetes bacterium HGW-Cloacimonetes-1]
MKRAYIKILAFGFILLICSAVYAQGTDMIRTLSISPNPMEKYTEICIDFNMPCDVTIYIEDGVGNVVRYLYDGVVGKEMVLNWNRIGDDGNYAPAGKYSVVVNYSSRYTSTKKTLILK